MKNLSIPLLVLAAIASAPLGLAQNAEDRSKVIAPAVDEHTVFVLHADLTRVDVGAVVGLVPADLFEGANVQALSMLARTWLSAFTKAGGKEVYVVRSIRGGPDAFLAVVPLSPGADVKTLSTLLRELPRVHTQVEKERILAGPEEVLMQVRRMKPIVRPELARALAAAGDAGVQAVLLPPETLRRALLEVMPTLPPAIGDGSMTVLTRGIQWVALGIDAKTPVSMSVTVQSQDAAAAKELTCFLERLAEIAGRQAGLKELPEFTKMLDVLRPKVDGDRLRLSLTEKDVRTVLTPLIMQVQRNAEGTRAMENLKRIALAMHNYAATHKSLPPPASHDKQGKALLSWRVHLLPYLGEENLYREFRLDEPWDSEHNKKLIPKMPAVYRSAAGKKAEAGLTTYLVPVGKATLFPGGKGITFREVTDGLSQTILVIDAADEKAVVWTRPADWPFDPREPTAGLFRAGAQGFAAAIADGSVRLVPRSAQPKAIGGLFTRNGGESDLP
jgi:hypothetical protein